MVLAKFRQRYPQGSLVSELIEIDRGTYIVGVSVIVNNLVLATGLAGADTVETAEDSARERAIALLMLDSNDTASQHITPLAKPQKNPVRSSPVPPTQPSVTQQPFAPSSYSNTEDSNVANTDYPTKPEIQPEANVAPPNKESVQPPVSQIAPDVEVEQAQNEAIPEEIVPAAQPVRDSANLFAGTSNPNISGRDISEDTQNIPAETSTDGESTMVDTLEEVNFNEIKHQTDLEIKRLGWTKDDGREFLKSRYGKRSRLQLTDNQLLEFLQYLASQPSPS